MGLVIIALLAALTLWTTTRNIQMGIAHPVLQVIGMQEFERAEKPAFFWGDHRLQLAHGGRHRDAHPDLVLGGGET